MKKVTEYSRNLPYINPGNAVFFISYIKNNPVKAGLVQDWKGWEYTYIDKRYIDKN